MRSSGISLTGPAHARGNSLIEEVFAVRLPTALAATVLAAALTSCSSGSSATNAADSSPGPAVAATIGSDGVQRVTIEATDMFRFEPATISAHPGSLTITLVDNGGYPHNLSVSGLHTTSHTVTGGPGQSRTTFMVRFPGPGTYPFECTFHSSAGMRGEFVIR